MAQAHCLGFPRIGAMRENKRAVESYWRKEISQEQLDTVGQTIRQRSWQQQADSGLDFVTVGDFSWYDHVLDTSALLGIVPERFGNFSQKKIDLDTIFRMARGRAPHGNDAKACEMTKWFDTNYHYIVPELSVNQTFSLSTETLFQQIEEAQKLGHNVKAVLLGPLSLLYLAKIKGQDFDKLSLLNKLLPVYQEVLQRLQSQGVEWLQMDEPILVLDLTEPWFKAFETSYQQLQRPALKILLTSYFGGLAENHQRLSQLPVAGLHLDLVRTPEQLTPILQVLPADKILSLGVVDGRNIWRTDCEVWIDALTPIKKQLGDRLWISSSCSLLHSPVDLSNEHKLDDEVKSWLAFATEKLSEINLIRQGIMAGKGEIESELAACRYALRMRAQSSRIHNPEVQQRLLSDEVKKASRANPYAVRAKKQREVLDLGQFPTTTIGSFPQTQAIRQIRKSYKNKKIDWRSYCTAMEEEIKTVINKQEEIGLDVLVHGEPERSDSVEYFGELLHGILLTENAWVQSYGSRYVKPPIIYGDVSRAKAMTVKWSQFAQANTDKWMKGMLTGPMTILCWSFVRDDIPRSNTALQIALALRDEVLDLEKSGIRIIQIDEPAFREGLPLRQTDWQDYLKWATHAFRVAACAVQDTTQIHTHMCYAEFNDIIKAIAALDADVITIESSRSQMELLEAFENFEYPNEIGPGVYDIHTPLVPSVDDMVTLLEKAQRYIPAERLWVNPDCGLKTRDWPEVEAALRNMVAAAKRLRVTKEQKNIEFV